MIQALRRRIFDRLVLRPSRQPIDCGNQERVMLEWGVKNESLECFVQRLGELDAPLDLLIVKFPGTAGRGERSTAYPAAHFQQANSEIWTWNPPGYGGSAGRASMSRIAEASLAFWHAAIQRDRITDDTRIWIAGNSLGCATALHVAAVAEVAGASEVAEVAAARPRFGMLLRNPPPLSAVVKHVANRYPLGRMMYPVADSLIAEMNAITPAARVRLPAIFFQSERDELVLPEFQKQVIDAYAGPKQVVLLTGLKHGGLATEEHEAEIKDALGWLWEQTGADGKTV